ncbi:hypothetical protein EP331_00235 [bacterium]|nr:MAG: hypothetical protein EP331_00235 [bacterium]
MIAELKRVSDNLKFIRDNLNKVIQDVLIGEREYIAELNRKQLWKGKKSDGTDMPSYVPNSKAPNAPGKIVLFDTGAFHAGFDALIEDDQFEVIGTDTKTSFLTKKYGHILDLNEESLQELRRRIKPKIEKRLFELASK